MANYSLANAILAKIDADPTDVVPYKDLFGYCHQLVKTDEKAAHAINEQLRARIGLHMKHNPQELYLLYRESLLLDAVYSFDAYLIFMELGREPKDRFYQPRRKILKRVVDALQQLADGELEELFLSLPPRTGKLVADNTPILTTKGWKKHGELKVGDYVFSPEGKAVMVNRVFPKDHTTHTVTFSDGTQIKCHFRHEWKVYDRRFGREHILETQEMIGHLENGGTEHVRGHRYNFMIPNKEPIKGVKTDLPVKPYTLGAWLGDGTNTKPYITGDKNDYAVIEGIIEDGYTLDHTYTHKTYGTKTYAIGGLRKDLAKIGLCHYKIRHEKYIPQEYLTAPIEDRLQLLAGLLDTDGCLVRKEKRYHFSTTSEGIRDGIIQLISTFGWRVGVKIEEPHVSSSGIELKKRCWIITFNPTMHIPCRLERKQLFEFSKQRRIAIAKIEPSEPEQGNCISVDGGMYLVGDRMIQTHNSSLIVFFITWLIGRDSDKPNLYSSYTGIVTGAFYDAVLEIITDPDTYNWHIVFPTNKIASTDAAELTIDINRRKHYHSLTCRSIDGTLNGACDASDGFIIGDDLVSGIEEALSKERMISKWSKVDNNLIPRGKGNSRYLWIGTRWSVIDPIGLRLDLLENDIRYKSRKYKVINLPALNDKDESNFDYPYGVGFDTLYYQQRRASFERNNDMASWLAQYMGVPIEREGTLFTPNDFRYYNGELPEGEPDRVFMAVDPAYGGGDFVAAPICAQYGDDIYVVDVVYDNGDKKVTQPLIAGKAKKYNVSLIQIEGDKSTIGYKEGVEEELKKIEYRVTLTTRQSNTQGNKQQRIFDKAPDIREMMLFLESGKRQKDYVKFMENVFAFKMFLAKSGLKKQHDDAPDSLAQAVDMVVHPRGRYSIFKRPC